MNNNQINTSELIEFSVYEAIKQVTTMKQGMLIEAKEALPEHLLETLRSHKLMKVFGRAFSKSVKVGDVNLTRADNLSSNRHNQYIVTHQS